MKKVLAINYSQTGQLDDILDNFLKGFSNVEVDRVKIDVVDKFLFPWTMRSFLDAMPESVLEEPVELQPLNFKYDSYDLVILGHQPWFLSPSIPTTSLLHDPVFKKLIKDTPIVTVVAARNMWINCQLSVTNYINEAEAKLVANIPLINKAQNQIGALSKLHWLLSGKKTKKWGVFPKPGVSDEDIRQVNDFGEIVYNALEIGSYQNLQDDILKLNRISIATDVLLIELKVKRVFKIWAKLIKKKGTTPSKRRAWLTGFKYYLIFTLFCLSPVVLLIFYIFIRPFKTKSIAEKKRYYCGVNY